MDYPYLDSQSTELTLSINHLREHIERNFPGSRRMKIEHAVTEKQGNVIVRTKLDSGYLYYSSTRFCLKTSVVPSGFSTDLDTADINWTDIPDSVDGVYLNPYPRETIPWPELIAQQKWEILICYLEIGRMQGEERRWIDVGPNVRELFNVCDIDTFDKIMYHLWCNVRGVATQLLPEDVQIPEKRRWIIEKVSNLDIQGTIMFSPTETWIRWDKIGVFIKLGILPKIGEVPAAAFDNPDLMNFPEILQVMANTSWDILDADLETGEFWETLGITPVYRGNNTKRAI